MKISLCIYGLCTFVYVSYMQLESLYRKSSLTLLKDSANLSKMMYNKTNFTKRLMDTNKFLGISSTF